MDWDGNGHEDYDDGFLDALFFFGPWPVTLAMALIFIIWLIYRNT
jgi:hypothetical protein